MIIINSQPLHTDLATEIAQATQGDDIRFWWLGQAGFAFKHADQLILIDPYLSDSLAKKYKDQEFKHLRMMPVPIAPENINACSWYLCTHGHTDHMDAESIQGVLQNSAPFFLIPKAELERGIQRGIPQNRAMTLDAGERIELGNDISVQAIAAAHENIELDNNGYIKHLGYIITIAGVKIYHSGDCIPYPELSDVLYKNKVAVAFLPINGRDDYRTSRGVLGNFTIEEAIQLCWSAKIPYLVGHHFDMFSFNTIDRNIAAKILKENQTSLAWLLPEIGITYSILVDKP